jgi:hypothetical protein
MYQKALFPQELMQSKLLNINLLPLQIMNFIKEIKSDVQTFIRKGEDPQAAYEQVCEKYSGNERDRRFLRKFIAKKVQHTVTPQNRKEFSFSYHLYLISLWIAFLVTLISKQHRIEALGITTLSSVPLWTAFLVFNLFAWIYMYLALRSIRFNLSMSYQALFVATLDVVRLLVLFPVYWSETPFFSILRLIPPLLVIIFGVFYVVNCSNPFSKNKNGEIIFYKIKRQIRIGRKRISGCFLK